MDRRILYTRILDGFRVEIFGIYSTYLSVFIGINGLKIQTSANNSMNIDEHSSPELKAYIDAKTNDQFYPWGLVLTLNS